MKWLAGFLMLFALAASAEERVNICFNYGCQSQAEVVYSDAQLRELRALLREAKDAEQEREAIGLAVGRLLGWAGQQSPISADRGGNYADLGVYGKMDCIDHSMSTTRLLKMLEAQGMLHYHRVLERVLRRPFLVLDHYSAQIEELSADTEADEDAVMARRYVVDSWFFDNGQPAIVWPLARWMTGESPNGGG
jgi:hypothetical protein